jgi:hypothetical protein
MSPAFISTTTGYTATVSNTTTSITVTPTVSQAQATLTVNGSPVTSGTPSAPIALNLGSNLIPLVVTAQDGATTKTYNVTVTRTALAPTVVTSAASGVGTTGVTLNSSVNANNANTTVSFDYGTTINYGSNMAAPASPLSGGATTPVSASLSGLVQGQVYHYRARAANATSLQAPLITTVRGA